MEWSWTESLLGQARRGELHDEFEFHAHRSVLGRLAHAQGQPLALALEDASLAPAARRFYAESKRVSNARAKAELGWRPDFPTYREGLTSILQAGG